jgi:hypothetical protein
MASTLTALLTKSKVRGAMDGIFVSSRAAQVLAEINFKSLCRDQHTLVAVETAKHLVPLKADVQAALIAKEEELAVQLGFQRVTAPVPRRRRDEADQEDDVIFFTQA